MTWFKKGEEEKEEKEKREELKPSDHLWVKCNSCNEIIYRKVIERNLQVCSVYRNFREAKDFETALAELSGEDDDKPPARK